MKISTKGRYAVRLMLDIAVYGKEKNVSMRDTAERQNISLKYLEQIVSQLAKAGLLRSIRGANGGYMLARSASEYTIGDILRTVEGSLSPVACLDNEINICPRAARCPTVGFWQGLYDVINSYVDGVTLEQLAKSCENDGSDVGFRSM